MKQVSRKVLALLLVIYIVFLAFRVYTNITTGYAGFGEESTATVGFYNNHWPWLEQDISDIEWNQGYSYAGLDLDNYFNDTAGEILNYTFAGPQNIAISISEANVVTFIASSSSWTGTNYVIFTAIDPWELTNTSNNISLTVKPYSPPPSTPGAASSSSGGGTRYNEPACITNWACTDWTACKENITYNSLGYQTRNCIDLHHCDVNTTMPSETQTCRLPEVPTIGEEFVVAIEPIIKEVSHRPVLLLVFALGAVFSIEIFVYYNQRKKKKEIMGSRDY